ncbi:MAG: hypothetical protein QXW98_08170 [Candidatus Caldarchaeum sp.]
MPDLNPNLPDGTMVELELKTPVRDPLWGLLADQPELIERLRQIVEERQHQPCP